MLRRTPSSTLFPTRRSSDLKHGRHRPPISVDDRPAPGRQDPHQIARDPTAGDIGDAADLDVPPQGEDRKSTRLNSSHTVISYAVFCLKKKKTDNRCNE